MGRALEVLNGTAVNPGATITAVTPNSGDSFTVRATAADALIHLVDAWAFTTTNLLLRVRSPRMHDQAQNLRLQPVASSAKPLTSLAGMERLYSQDPITVELTGGAAETDLAALLVYYEDLPGVAARLHSWAEVRPQIQHITTVEVDLTSAAAAGAYSASVALNGTFDTLIRNRDYAILGYQCATSGGSLGLRGADTGNIRVGGPLINQPEVTNTWFIDLGNYTGLPCIPVINSGNVAAFLLDATAQATAAALHVGVHLALLNSPSGLS